MQKLRIFLLCVTPLALFGCEKKVDVNILKDRVSETLFFTITNSDEVNYYISDNSWLYFRNDTLFVEAVYMPENDDSVRVMFNQFIPPGMKVLGPHSKISKRILYRDLKIATGKFASVRIFRSRFPMDLNSTDVHSIRRFYDFQRDNSFYSVGLIQEIDSVDNW